MVMGPLRDRRHGINDGRRLRPDLRQGRAQPPDVAILNIERCQREAGPQSCCRGDRKQSGHSERGFEPRQAPKTEHEDQEHAQGDGEVDERREDRRGPAAP
jgi:hypothetical protein